MAVSQFPQRSRSASNDRWSRRAGLALFAFAGPCCAEFMHDVPLPQITGAQGTMIWQHLDQIESPYSTDLSLRADGDTESTYTWGVYLGWEPLHRLQLYLDIEQFQGSGVSAVTGLGSLTNGDAIRGGSEGLSRDPYLARKVIRYWLPLGSGTHAVERDQDQLSGNEADQRIDFKAGFMSVADDFDKNRYANSARTQFENWSLFNDTAFDFAADTRGYTGGGVVTWVENAWQARFGLYQMPKKANGQQLDGPLTHARGQYAEFTWQPKPDGYAIRVLGFENTAKMGDYGEAIAIAQSNDTTPDIVADDKQYRRKYGAAINGELPLFDGGETGLFMRLGWNNGKTEDFAFTEVDRHLSVGGQVSGVHWWRANDRLGIAYVLGGLSGAHRAYLADGGEGFVLGDGRITYGTEQVLEAYYNFAPIKYIQISPDVQYIRNPGYNSDRGPAFVSGFRLNLEY